VAVFIPEPLPDFAFYPVFGSVYFGIVPRRRRPPKSKNPPKKWQHLTGITGSLSSEWVAGFASDYPRGLENGKVKWNNCTIAMAMSRDAEFPTGAPISYMEDFSYLVTANMLNPENFTTFTENSAFAKNLIWDMMAIEGFGWSAWDKLKLNEPYSAKDFNGKMDLAGQGSFENKDVIFTWTGISKLNSENCAVIEYRTMNNPLDYSGEGMTMKGRSHYWGTIWVSMEDKQIEHAVLFEDVVMEMNLPGQTNKQIMNATREISFVKVL
jgi:hypothetical protein